MQTARWVTVMKPSFIREILKVTAQPGVISFAGGLPAPELFPVPELVAAFADALAGSGRQLLQYSPTEGDPGLRAVLSERLTERRVPAGPDDILLTNGSQHGLDLVAKALIDPGDLVLVENPTYLGALQAFGPYGPRIQPVESDEEGMLPGALADAVARERPKLVYVMPTFQNPRGTSMGAARRTAIAAVCRQAAVAVVEDDPYGELRYRGEEQPGIRSFWDQAIYLGTFSKTLAPGLRLGWVTAPPALMGALKLGLQATCLHVGTLTQRVAAMVLSSADYPIHLARLRQEYGRRMSVMLGQMESAFPAGTRWSNPDGGLFIWVELPDGLQSLDLFHLAVAQKVAFVPGQPFFVGEGGDSMLRLNFSNSTPAQITEGMARLGRAIAQLTGAGAPLGT
jgi:2-aminoadipate transaminase